MGLFFKGEDYAGYMVPNEKPEVGKYYVEQCDLSNHPPDKIWTTDFKNRIYKECERSRMVIKALKEDINMSGNVAGLRDEILRLQIENGKLRGDNAELTRTVSSNQRYIENLEAELESWEKAGRDGRDARKGNTSYLSQPRNPITGLFESSNPDRQNLPEWEREDPNGKRFRVWVTIKENQKDGVQTNLAALAKSLDVKVETIRRYFNCIEGWYKNGKLTDDQLIESGAYYTFRTNDGRVAIGSRIDSTRKYANTTLRNTEYG